MSVGTLRGDARRDARPAARRLARGGPRLGGELPRRRRRASRARRRRARRRAAGVRTGSTEQRRRERARAPARCFSPALSPFALAGFAYVGIESALTVFAVPYAIEASSAPIARGLASISVFWIGLLAGAPDRPLALPFAPDARWIAAAEPPAPRRSLIGGCVPAPELVFGSAGLALGCVYPLAIALAAQRFPDARGTATGLTAGAGALGGLRGAVAARRAGRPLRCAHGGGSLALWSLMLGGAALLARRGPR